MANMQNNSVSPARFWLTFFSVTLLLAMCDTASAQRPEPAVPEFHPIRLLKELPPITNVPVLTIDDVTTEVLDDELVLGVIMDGEARAYPINMLTGPKREIINDKLGGKSIAATW